MLDDEFSKKLLFSDVNYYILGIPIENLIENTQISKRGMEFARKSTILPKIPYCFTNFADFQSDFSQKSSECRYTRR